MSPIFLAQNMDELSAVCTLFDRSRVTVTCIYVWVKAMQKWRRSTKYDIITTFTCSLYACGR